MAVKLFFIAVFLCASRYSCADISYIEFSGDLRQATQAKGACTIDGTIQAADILRAKQLLPTKCMDYGYVFLNSPGGDVNVAMEIGRMLRRQQLGVDISPGNVCGSSCVFVFAAGVRRLNRGHLLIHRPYSGDATSAKTFESAQQFTTRVAAKAKMYLREMNVAESLYEAMQAIPPESFRQLSIEEQTAFGLIGIDPAYGEYLSNIRAHELGLTKTEFVRKKAQAVSTCGAVDTPYPEVLHDQRLACWNTILPGYLKN